MKILFVVDQFFTANNGTTISARRFASALEDRGHEVRIAAPGEEGDTPYLMKEKHIPFFDKTIRKSGMVVAKPDRRKRKLTEAIEWADIVHFYVPLSLARNGIKICKKTNTPFTAGFHAQPENITYAIHLGRATAVNDAFYKWFNYNVFRHCSCIHCPSNFIAGQLTAHGYTSKLYVISNGIAPEFIGYRKIPKTEEFEGYYTLLSVGRLSHEKCQEIIIDAVALSRYADKIKLVLAGQGPCYDQYVERAKKLPVPPVIRFFQKDELIDMISMSDLYLHAAAAEIEAMSCMEAFAGGLVPVIADSPKSATPQFSLHEKCLFEVNDAQALADRIDWWLEHPEERTEMGHKYSESAKQYTLAKSAEKLEHMFLDAIEMNKKDN